MIDKIKNFHLNQAPDLKVQQILASFKTLQLAWSENGYYYNKAKAMDCQHLSIISHLLDPLEIRKRLVAEFGDIKGLDQFVRRKNYDGKIKYQSLGTVLHVTAGNVFLGAVDSFIMGTVTKNKNIIKLPSNPAPELKLFTESVRDLAPEISKRTLFLCWKGGEIELEQEILSYCDGVIAWGGNQMIDHYQQITPSGVKFISHGAKISFHVISKAGLKILDWDAVLRDITQFDQQACANSQNIFLESGIDIKDFMQKLSQRVDYKRCMDDDQAVELLKQRELAQYEEYEHQSLNIFSPGLDLIESNNLSLEPTALAASIRVKIFSDLDALYSSLYPARRFLQTCGLAVGESERDQYLDLLSRAGVNRFTNSGAMLEGLVGSSHDGEFNLLSLTRVVSDESLLPSFKNKQDIRHIKAGGFYFASGGTTGEPKFSFYANSEFEQVAKVLAESYQTLGLTSEDRVANLFMPGQMWSSFSAVQKALEYCDVQQFPLGGNVSPDYFKKVISFFDVDTVFGLPSLLIDLAEKTSGLKIKRIFYSGESLNVQQQAFLKNAWGVEKFISAGYATVDAGPIGFQDPAGMVGEHILFDNLVDLKLVDGQAVVSSKIREFDPVISQPSGDKIELLPSHDGKMRFSLKGRADQKINIWAARFELSEIKGILQQMNYQTAFQVQLKNIAVKEIFHLVTEQEIDREQFCRSFYALDDICNTRDYQYIYEHLEFSSGNFLRNSRTGKTPNLLDLRKS